MSHAPSLSNTSSSIEAARSAAAAPPANHIQDSNPNKCPTAKITLLALLAIGGATVLGLALAGVLPNMGSVHYISNNALFLSTTLGAAVFTTIGLVCLALVVKHHKTQNKENEKYAALNQKHSQLRQNNSALCQQHSELVRLQHSTASRYNARIQIQSELQRQLLDTVAKCDKLTTLNNSVLAQLSAHEQERRELTEERDALLQACSTTRQDMLAVAAACVFVGLNEAGEPTLLTKEEVTARYMVCVSSDEDGTPAVDDQGGRVVWSREQLEKAIVSSRSGRIQVAALQDEVDGLHTEHAELLKENKMLQSQVASAKPSTFRESRPSFRLAVESQEDTHLRQNDAPLWASTRTETAQVSGLYNQLEASYSPGSEADEENSPPSPEAILHPAVVPVGSDLEQSEGES